jgi:hypothetical protein
MCVWDGTYTLSEEEREALDQVPGWNDDAVRVREPFRTGPADPMVETCL